jgi:hypothetical protein
MVGCFEAGLAAAVGWSWQARDMADRAVVPRRQVAQQPMSLYCMHVTAFSSLFLPAKPVGWRGQRRKAELASLALLPIVMV